ncbi:MAG TPA: SGNH/GDSL hydrolase family protein [Gemmatales bacterium]|nr:SGNH/GDSL hydrolase family protein [Gemmatales bacterium]HMP59730.1 SGNH/GDSL hydrolase family protein [Gemmatales bacterium]
MGHVVLLGDSIFDNGCYVADGPPVADQVRQALPPGWRASLLAVDGHITADVRAQLAQLPADATHLVVSVGGNDALGASSLLAEPACSVGDALESLHEVRQRFEAAYESMLQALARLPQPLAVCTIYDSVPGLGPAELTALAGFNEVILRQAFRSGLPVLDLRLVCDQEADYSPISRIEPSAAGGAKIARVIVDVVTQHDFRRGRSAIYF